MINPVITQSTVARRIPQPTLAEQHAIARHQAALAALDAADRTNALIDAIRVEHTAPKTMDQVVNDIRLRPQPDETGHFIDAATITTARIVALIMGGLMTFIAGVAVGSVL
ncbi:MAG TPA: hypothetical protein DCS21_05190 [Gammaproteobacteria bacterium]|nr:hypothetical protein [Gammaproteobacteria bacterium]